ncbi:MULTISPECIES: hypothetical protein [Pseudoalteromonas]|nr:hypothetical protein [Pseudoalteromonas nigrifaciens]
MTSTVATTLLVIAGDNPELKKESSFAALCGVSSLDALLGKATS